MPRKDFKNSKKRGATALGTLKREHSLSRDRKSKGKHEISGSQPLHI